MRAAPLSPSRVFSGNVSVSRGGYFDGTRTSYGVGRGVASEPPRGLWPVFYKERDRPSGEELVADLARLRLSLNPTTDLVVTAFVQYNSLIDAIVSNVRLRFIHAPLSDLYLVYSEQRDVRGDLRPQQSVALKVTRLLTF